MSGMHSSLLCLATGAVLFLVPATLRAQESSHVDLSEATTISNRMANTVKSPIENFRKMIDMRPAERDAFLTNYPAERRAQIAEKVQEYQMLPEPFRELRLRATELRRRPRYVALRHQDLEDDQQVEVEAAQIDLVHDSLKLCI